MSVSEPSSARSGVIPRGTRVEVFDEGQWHRGGKITSYVWGSNEYAILWDGCDETTMAGRHEVRRAVTEWQRVKHNNGFRVDSKKAPYPDWLDTQPNTRPSGRPTHNDPRSPTMDDSATQQSPWVPPSTARSVTIPVWTSELDESTTSTKKTKPHWEKKVSKHVRNYQVKGRPSFAVHKKKAVWDEWKTDREIPEGRDHPNKAMQKYWGRFAPPEAFESEEEEDRPEPVPKAKKPKKKSAPLPTPPAPVEDEPEQHEPEVHNAHEDEAEEEEHPQEEEVVEPVMSERLAAEEDPEEVEQTPGYDLPAAAPVTVSPPPVITRNAEEGDAETLSMLLEDSDEGAAVREHAFAKLVVDDTDDVAEDVLLAHLAGVTGLDATLVQEGTPLAMQALGRTAIELMDFRNFLVALDRYRLVKALYSEDDIADRSARVEPDQFETAIPLLAKWGVEMSDIEDAFTEEEEITFNAFFAWAVRVQGK